MAPNFMGLPFELRVEVYKLCLPIGKQLVLKPTACDKEDIAAGDLQVAPFPALLQVDRTIRAEAAVFFYQQNTWRIIDIPKGLRLPTIFKKNVRKATVTFDRRIFKIEDLWEISDDVINSEGRATGQIDNIHDGLQEHLMDIWTKKCTTLGKLSLTNLTLDFTRCVCPLGCCRMFKETFDSLEGCVTPDEDCKVTATGMALEHEAEMIHRHDITCVECFEGPGGACWRSPLDEED